MAIYAIGDIQGCYSSLRSLLDRIGFTPGKDRLWLTGDLVNRGPQSLQTLRFVKSLEPAVSMVLGNHDLNLLAVAADIRPRKPGDTFDELLAAEDSEILLSWLRQQPLFHRDHELGYCLVHAGLLPSWRISDAETLARETERVLRGNRGVELLRHMYGDEPAAWDDHINGWSRQRIIINAMTRMRYIDQHEVMDFSCKSPPGTQRHGLRPWYEARRESGETILFGHWSSLGATVVSNGICLDSGCAWGGALTAVRLDTDEPRFHQVSCH